MKKTKLSVPWDRNSDDREVIETAALKKAEWTLPVSNFSHGTHDEQRKPVINRPARLRKRVEKTGSGSS